METTAAHRSNLTRVRDDRIIGGVAGGLGRYFGIDPVIFRIGFFASLFIGGAGFALYLAAWLLIPDDGQEQSIFGRMIGTRPGRRRTLRVLILAGLAAIAACVALITVSFGALGVVAASSDVPVRGGVGDRYWSPASTSELRPAYRLAAGDLTLDLRHLGTLPEGETRVEATVAAGHVLVQVPRDAEVSVDASSGAGEVIVFGERSEGMSAERSVHTEAGQRLVITAKAGVGQVEIERG
jgi:phage shock protein PspC (stress-responsive transcriptional regulator)